MKFYSRDYPFVEVESPDDCYFYHTIEIPGFGFHEGDWDLRLNVDDYFGHVDLRGKDFLDVGCANGFLSFEAEDRGAHVMSFDIAPHIPWDITPSFEGDYDKEIIGRKAESNRLKRAYWLAHRTRKSRADVTYGSIYRRSDLPLAQISLMGCVLLHLANPRRALENVATHTSECLIVTDLLYEDFGYEGSNQLGNPVSWWRLNVRTIRSWMNGFGFENQMVYFHVGRFNVIGSDMPLFTVVGTRS
jgi:SAM-dependent methyltransferase